MVTHPNSSGVKIIDEFSTHRNQPASGGKVVDGRVEPLAVGGASVLSSTTRADGFVIVDDDSEGFAEGAEVDVWLYA
jgi:molybdopterin biosynthesis enzyme